SELTARRVARISPVKPLPSAGASSYILYLLPAPMLQLFWQSLLRPLGLGFEAQFAAIVLAGMPAIVGAAWLFYRVFEKPFISSAGQPVSEVKPRLAASATPLP